MNQATSIDVYLTRRYKAPTYTCRHLAAEVWKDLTGNDITELLERVIDRRSVDGFEILPRPVDPCLVMMQRLRTVPHLGVWLRGSVLHLQTKAGVQFMPLHVATFGFDRVRFFRPL